MLLSSVDKVSTYMMRSTIAITAFGVTAYELASLCIPSIHICYSDDHAMSSSIFDSLNMAITLGNHHRLTIQDISSAVDYLLNDTLLLNSLRESCSTQPLGRGFMNIANYIVTHSRINNIN